MTPRDYQVNRPCIYKIISPSNRIYIGQTVNFHRRLIHYKNGHCIKQRRLKASFDKYGFDAHLIKIIVYCDVHKLSEIERLIQDKYNVLGKNGLNIRLTSTLDRTGYLSEYSKRKISLANSGSGNGMYGRTIKESSKQLQRDKISGSNNYLSKWILNTNTGIYYECLAEAAFSVNMLKGSLWAAIVKYKVNNTSFIYA